MAIYTVTLHVVGQVYVDLYLKAQVGNDHDNCDHDNITLLKDALQKKHY